MTEKEKMIYAQLRKYKEHLESAGYNVFGVSLKGSQNYNLDDEGSDYDAVAIIIPTVKQMIIANAISTKIPFDNGELTINDIVSFTKLCAKGNPAWIEFVHSRYKIGDFSMFEHFKIKPRGYLGIAHEKLVALKKRFPSRVEWIDKYGFDPKQLHHIIRMTDVMEIWAKTKTQPAFITYCNSAKHELIDLKRHAVWNGKILTHQEAEALANDYINRLNVALQTLEEQGVKMVFENQDIDFDKIASVIESYSHVKKGFLEKKIMNLPNNRQVLKMGDSVNFLVKTSDNLFVFGRQKRAGSMDLSERLGLSGGYVDAGEINDEAMIRELFEETNIQKPQISDIRMLWEDKYVSEGYSNERNTSYILTVKDTWEELSNTIKCNDIDENIDFVALNYEQLMDLQKTVSGLRSFIIISICLTEASEVIHG